MLWTIFVSLYSDTVQSTSIGMSLKCEEVLKSVNDPASLLKLSAVAWINGRKNWDPELAEHLCKTSVDLDDIIFDCDKTVATHKIIYTYNSLREICKWENIYRPRWLSKKMKRDQVIVKLQDEVEMDVYPNKRVCRRLFVDE